MDEMQSVGVQLKCRFAREKSAAQMSVCEREECGSNVGLRERRVQYMMSVFERATIDVKYRISRGGSTS